MTLSDINSGEALQKLLQNRWLIWLVNILLALWLVWLLAGVALPYFRVAVEPEQIAASPLETVTTQQEVKAGHIADWHLFGKAEPVSLQKDKVIRAPDTKLDLVLRGIYFPEQGGGSIAIIQDATKLEQPFVIGDLVFELATLEQIHIDRVILLHNGKHETLRLPKESLGLEFVEDARVIASKAIQEFRNDLLTGNMEKYVSHVDYDTVYDENGFAGFQIIGDSEKGKETLRTIGLEDGDIVTEINGIDLANDPNMINALGNLRTARMVNLSIKRAGVLQNVTLDFTQK